MLRTKRSLSARVMTSAFCLSVAHPAFGGAVFYFDRAEWQSVAGPATFVEDFSSFGSDTPFRNAAVALHGMTIQQEGINRIDFRNLIDVVPLAVAPDSNGTNNASVYVDHPEPRSYPGTQVRISFEKPTKAFGFEAWGAATGEVTALDLVGESGLVGSVILGNDAGGFTGYVMSPGMATTSVLFRSANFDLGTSGEGFGLDNIAGVAAVPEPGALTLACLSLSILMGCRRYRSCNP